MSDARPAPTTTPEQPAPRAALSPAADPLATLPWFSRLAFRVISRCQAGPLYRVLNLWQQFVLEPLIWVLLLRRRLRVHGLERLAGVPGDAPILVLANHRSFFDLFIVGWVLLNRTGSRRRIVFPVRANFFYEHPLGVAINLLLAGGAMFPPFFRSEKQRGFNDHALEILQQRLRTPGDLVGFHPEGTRNQGPDPYTLLPAKPGAGVLALKARPEVTVVPVFIHGLSNHLFSEMWKNLRGQHPIHLVFGSPPDLSAWPEETRLSHHKKCADALLAGIGALGQEEKALRAAAAARAAD